MLEAESGAVRSTRRELSAESPARTTNTPRQPMACTSKSAGAVAVKAPKAPSITSQPVATLGEPHADGLHANHQCDRDSAAKHEPNESIGNCEDQSPCAREQNQCALDDRRPDAIEQSIPD